MIKTLLCKCQVLLILGTLKPNAGFAMFDTFSNEFALASVPAKFKTSFMLEDLMKVMGFIGER